MHACVHACLCVHICVRTYLCARVHIRVCAYLCMCACVCVLGDVFGGQAGEQLASGLLLHELIFGHEKKSDRGKEKIMA